MSKLTISKILNHETAPEKKNEGQFWYDTTKDVLNRSNGDTYTPIPVGNNLISAGSTDTVKGILDSKANDADVVKLTGDQVITGTKKFYEPSKLANHSVAISSEKIKLHYAEDNGYTEIGPSTINLSYGDTASTSISESSISIVNGSGSSFLSPSISYNSYFDGSNAILHSNGITVVDDDLFYGTIIGTPNIDATTEYGIPAFNTTDNSILFKVGINSEGSSISGKLIDNTISESALETHIPTSKAVYDLVKDKADKSELDNYQKIINYNDESSNSITCQGDGSYNYNIAKVEFGGELLSIGASNVVDSSGKKVENPFILTDFYAHKSLRLYFNYKSVLHLSSYESGSVKMGYGYDHDNQCTIEFKSDSISIGDNTGYEPNTFNITLNGSISGSAIDTTLSSTSTNEKLVSAKAVYDAIKDKADKSDLDSKQSSLMYYSEDESTANLDAFTVSAFGYEQIRLETGYGNSIKLAGNRGIEIDISDDELAKFSGNAIATTIDSSVGNTHNKLPTAKAVYDAIKNIDVNITPVNTLDLVLTSSSNKVYAVTPKMENNTPMLTIELQEGNTSTYKPCYILGEDGSSIYLLEVDGDKGSETFIVSNVSNSVSNINTNGIGLLIKGSDGINYNLVPAGEVGYEYYTLSCVKDSIPVVSINLDNGDAIINENTIYSLIIDSDTNFVLPEQKAGSFAQILVCAKITSDVNIDFGTTHFFNDEIPTIETNNNYDILFEHDPIENVWVCGTIKKG